MSCGRVWEHNLLVMFPSQQSVGQPLSQYGFILLITYSFYHCFVHIYFFPAIISITIPFLSEQLRRKLLGLVGDEANAVSVLGANFSAAFVAGSLAAAATCPLDVAKTRRQIEVFFFSLYSILNRSLDNP